MSHQDLAEVDCRTPDIKMQLVKLIETAIEQTSERLSTPLSSLLPFLLLSEERQVFLERLDYTPLDFTIIRFRLLQDKYPTLLLLAKDINHALTHYENVRETYGMPDIVEAARDIVIEGLNNLPFAQFLQQPLDFDILLEEEAPQSINCLTIREATIVLYLTEDLDEDQNQRLEQYCGKEHLVTQGKVELSRIPPRAARELYDFIRELATPAQISSVERRIEIVDYM